VAVRAKQFYVRTAIVACFSVLVVDLNRDYSCYGMDFVPSALMAFVAPSVDQKFFG